jgi:hypothetical protein
MKRKGIALPIDMLVILAIAVIILIAIVAVFMGVWSPFATNQQGRANFNNACSVWVNTGCGADPKDVPNLCDKAADIVLSSSEVDTCKSTETDDATKTVKNKVRSGCGCPAVR